MTWEEAIEKFGFVPDVSVLDEVRQALQEESLWRRGDKTEEYHEDLLLVLCVQLFAAGQVEDSLNIWRVKQGDFDAVCYIDGEFLCGAGVEVTKEFLSERPTEETAEVMEYIERQNWDGFSPEKHLAHYRRYFGLPLSDS